MDCYWFPFITYVLGIFCIFTYFLPLSSLSLSEWGGGGAPATTLGLPGLPWIGRWPLYILDLAEPELS